MGDTVTNTSLRYSTDGLDTARQQLQDFGDAGDAAMAKVGVAADAMSDKLDKASSSLDGVSAAGDNLSSFSATLSPLQQQLDAFGDALDKINEGFSTNIDSSDGLTRALGDVASGTAAAGEAELGFIALLATGYAAVANSNYARTLTADILNLQRATGDSYASYAATGDAIKALGGDSQNTNAAISQIKDAILGVGDQSQTTRAAIAAFGVSLEGLSASDAPEVLQQIIDRSQEYADSRQKTALIEAATGQSSVQWLKEIATAQDFTNEQTRQSETVLGEMAQSATDAEARIKQIGPGLFGDLIAWFNSATTESEQWAEDAGRSTQEVQQGWALMWAGFENTNWSAVSDGWDQLTKGAHNYALTLENELIPDWGKYIGLVPQGTPDFTKPPAQQQLAAPSLDDAATAATADKYTQSLIQQNEALLLSADDQAKLNDETEVYNAIMGLFADKSPAWIQAHMNIVTALLDQGNAFAELKRSMDAYKATQDAFTAANDDLTKSIDQGMSAAQGMIDAAAKADDQRQETIQGLADEANQSAVLLQAYQAGNEAYKDAQESEQILTAVRNLGADATQAEKDAVANYTAAIIENKDALDAAKQASDNQNSYQADVTALTQKNQLLQQEIDIGGQLKGQQDAHLAGEQAEIEYEKQKPGLLQDQYDAYGKLIEQQTQLKNAINDQNRATSQLVTDIGKAGETVFTQMFTDIGNHGIKAFADLGNIVYQEFLKLAGEIAVLMIFHPDVSITGALSLATGGSALSGASSLAGAGSLFSGGSIFSSGGAIGGLFSSQGAIEVPTFADDGSVTGLTNFGDDPGIFSASGSIGSIFSSGGALSGVGDVLGTIGSALPYVGLLAGAGALIGSLFGGPPQNNDGVVYVGSDHGDGQLHIAGSTSDHQDLSQGYAMAQQLVTDVNSFASQYGLKVTGGNSQGIGISVGPNRNTDYSGSEAESIAKLIKDGDFSSTNPAIEALLKTTNATDLTTLSSEIQKIQQGASALSATLDLTGHAVTSVQSSMQQLSTQFETDKADAVSLGFTVAQVSKGYRDAFNVSISDQLQETNNPKAAALASEQRDAASRLATAKELGADLVNVEKVNGEARLAVFEQYDGTTVAALKNSLDVSGHTLSSVQTSMQATIKTFEEAMKAAQDFATVAGSGAPTTGQVQGAYARQFNVSISDQLLAINDPEAAALHQEALDAQARLNAAKKLGADLVEVEKLNAADRLAVVTQYEAATKTAAEQLLSGAASNLSSFIASLPYSSSSALTAQQQLALAQTQFANENALADKGNVTALANLSTYDQAYLTAAKAVYGTSAAYTAIYNEVVKSLNNANVALGSDEARKNAELIAKQTANSSSAIVTTLKTELALVRQQLELLNKTVKQGGSKPARLVA